MAFLGNISRKTKSPRFENECGASPISVEAMVTREKALTYLPIRERLIDKFKAIEKSGLTYSSIMSKIKYDIRAIEKSLMDHGIEFLEFAVEESSAFSGE